MPITMVERFSSRSRRINRMGEAELRFTRDADGVNLLLDRDGDGTADARLELHGLSGLGLGDLIL